ncbi:MAG: transporter substrate-binding domain-containing protein, partial [Gammaproteobacteria bacterium]|nr:transporter substrate-binding domain-containing protein [Gammaproteobacteria bacterium]
MLHAHEANHGHRDTAGELNTLELFAELRGLKLQPVYVHRPADLATSLAANDADIAISTPPQSRDTGSALIATEAVNRERYIVVGANTATASSPLDFAGARIGIRHSSPQWAYFEQLAGQLEGVYLEALPDYISRTEILNLVARGVYDFTAVAGAAGENPLQDHPRLAELFELSPEQPVHWYVTAERAALADELNEHLRRYQPLAARSSALLGDLDRIASRHVLRVITRIDSQNYFLRNGKPAGFEHGLVRRLGRQLGLRVEFLVAESDEQMTEWLISGYGDLISARLDGAAVAGDPGVVLSRRYHYGATTIVSRPDLDISNR